MAGFVAKFNSKSVSNLERLSVFNKEFLLVFVDTLMPLSYFYFVRNDIFLFIILWENLFSQKRLSYNSLKYLIFKIFKKTIWSVLIS